MAKKEVEHYYPYKTGFKKSFCGIDFDEIDVFTSDINRVTCKKCLSAYNKKQKEVEQSKPKKENGIYTKVHTDKKALDSHIKKLKGRNIICEFEEIPIGYELIYYPKSGGGLKNFTIRVMNKKNNSGDTFYNVRSKSHKQALSEFLKVPESKIVKAYSRSDYVVYQGIYIKGRLIMEKGDGISFNLNK